MVFFNLLLLTVIVNAVLAEQTTDAGNNASSVTPNSCPTWFRPYSSGNATCRCGHDISDVVRCNETTHETTLLDCYCMTYNESTGPVVGACFYNCIHHTLKHKLYYPVTPEIKYLNRDMCKQNDLHRGGQLCGKCEENYWPLAYSYDLKCEHCPSSASSWVVYILVAFLPLTVFFIIVLSCGLSATSPKLSTFVFLSQTVAIGANVRIVLAEVGPYPLASKTARIIFSLYGIWNLDFFRTLIPHVCLRVSTLQALALDYVVAFYPLVLLSLTYVLIELHSCNVRVIVVLCRPFCRCVSCLRSHCDVKTSIVGAFATFFLLSYLRILSVSFDLLVPMNVHNMNGHTVGSFLYYDATIEYFGQEHLPYAIVAIFITIVFTLFPLLLLLLYPMRCFQRCLGFSEVSSRWHALRIFIDAFQGCYKDGTNGTRDCRYFAAFHFFVRFLLFTIFGFTLNGVFYAAAVIVFICVGILIAVIQPYKPHLARYSTVDSVLFLNLAMWCAAVVCVNVTGLQLHRLLKSAMLLSFFVGVLPLFYMSFVTLCWMCSRKEFGRRMTRRIRDMIRENQWQLSGSAVEESLPHRLINPDEYEEDFESAVPSETNQSRDCSSETANENQSTY